VPVGDGGEKLVGSVAGTDPRAEAEGAVAAARERQGGGQEGVEVASSGESAGGEGQVGLRKRRG
jgi:hypothetical protein